MKKNINKFLIYYLFILFVFGTFYLYEKHTVGNDSTISEWIINYSGGFTKRGIIGHLCIYFAEALSLNLRESILIFQISILGTYFVVLYYFFKDLEFNKLILLSIFTPIFILYPIAEIEVLARKEIFIFCLYLLYLNIYYYFYKIFYKIFLLPVAILIWEPVIFFFPFWLSVDLISIKINKFNSKFFENIITYIPAVLIAFFIAINPMTQENHATMSLFLKSNFNEICYMSCSLLKSKSTIYDQFVSNLPGYSFTVSDVRLFSSFVGTGVDTPAAQAANSTETLGTSTSKTVIGTTLTMRATGVNTLFGSNSTLYATLTVVGRDSGARLQIPIQINKAAQTTA